MPRTTLFVTNVVFLVLGPISAVVLLAWVFVLSRKHARAEAPEPDVSAAWARVKQVLITALGWGRFWIALLISVALHIGFSAGYVTKNPFVSYTLL